MTEQLARGQRRPLPSRRANYVQKARIGNEVIYLCPGEYEDGTLGEIFIDCSRAGSSLRAMINAFAISMSIGLQRGVPLAVYVNAFKNFKFLPSGPVVHDERFTEATSILDYVMRELEATYLGGVDDTKRFVITPDA